MRIAMRWLCVLFLSSPVWAAPADLEWVMINVNHRPRQQADAHLLRVNGEATLIDVGFDGERIVAYLKDHQISSLRRVIVTHAHRDHYGGLIPILEAGIAVKEVVFNPPDTSICDREKPWGCDSAHWREMLTTL